jgi:hypothetical protein
MWRVRQLFLFRKSKSSLHQLRYVGLLRNMPTACAKRRGGCEAARGVQSGARADVSTKEVSRCSHFICFAVKCFEICRLLLESKADVDVQDFSQSAPLCAQHQPRARELIGTTGHCTPDLVARLDRMSDVLLADARKRQRKYDERTGIYRSWCHIECSDSRIKTSVSIKFQASSAAFSLPPNA